MSPLPNQPHRHYYGSWWTEDTCAAWQRKCSLVQRKIFSVLLFSEISQCNSLCLLYFQSYPTFFFNSEKSFLAIIVRQERIIFHESIIAKFPQVGEIRCINSNNVAMHVFRISHTINSTMYIHREADASCKVQEILPPCDISVFTWVVNRLYPELVESSP